MATKEININNNPGNTTVIQTNVAPKKIVGDGTSIKTETVVKTEPVKSSTAPSMISIGPLKVSHPDMGIAIMGVIVIVVGGIIIKKWLRKTKKKKNKKTKKK